MNAYGVAGIAGAVRNNGTGITDIAWNVKIMPLKYQPDDPADPVFASFFVNAINYAVNNGALVSNHSYTIGSAPIASIKAAIDAAGLAGHLVVAAAGFGNVDQDTNPTFPSSYTSSNLIAVSSINNKGNLSNNAKFGAVSVDLGAPGTNIITT